MESWVSLRGKHKKTKKTKYLSTNPKLSIPTERRQTSWLFTKRGEYDPGITEVKIHSVDQDPGLPHSNPLLWPLSHAASICSCLWLFKVQLISSHFRQHHVPEYFRQTSTQGNEKSLGFHKEPLFEIEANSISGTYKIFIALLLH